MKSCLYIFVITIAILVWGCNNIEDASPSDSNSFIKFLHGPYNYSGVEVETLPAGYALLGNMEISDDSTVAFIIHTDKKGNQVGSTIHFPGVKAKAFEVTYGGDQVTGYMILGDSIKINPDASKVGDIEIYSASILKVDNNGTILKKVSYSDKSQDSTRVKVDFKSNSIRVTDQGDVLVLGTYREDLSRPEKSFIVCLDDNFVIKWYKDYDLLDAGQTDYNYVNSKSLHYKNSFIIWASAILKPTQSFNDSYLAVPYVKEASVFNNFSQLGTGTSQLFLARDIQPARSSSLGYGVVGTRGQTDGSQANMFFVRVDAQGNFVPNSVRYFDGILSSGNVNLKEPESESQDQGETLTSTKDGGYVLAGATQIGNEARDIYLVKVSATGDIIWNRILGGIGDEMVSSVREEEDGSLVLCGTNNLSGLSSIFIIKTDSNGELKK